MTFNLTVTLLSGERWVWVGPIFGMTHAAIPILMKGNFMSYAAGRLVAHAHLEIFCTGNFHGKDDDHSLELWVMW